LSCSRIGSTVYEVGDSPLRWFSASDTDTARSLKALIEFSAPRYKQIYRVCVLKLQ
jgi:hypothetical protein